MSLPKPSPDTHVLVTGASSGIGAEIARVLAGRGHALTVVARRRDRLDELAADLPVDVTVVEADLGDTASRRKLVAAVEADPRALVGLVNCAGFGTSGKFLDLDLQRELQQIEVNVTALMELTHLLAPAMVARGEGAILNVASIAAFQPIPGMGTYSATKAFVQTFSEAFHTELSGTGVSCTVLCPGPVETEWAQIADAGAVMVMPGKVSPQGVAKAAVDGMVHGKRSVVPGIVAATASTLGQHTPRTILLPALKAFTRR